jgi:methionyl aminopeptidase
LVLILTINKLKKNKILEKDKLLDYQLECLRKSAECHRQVRRHCQKIIRPGKRLIDV